MRGGVLDNRWVIPYNPFLLTMFDSHVNVEICSTIKVVKYLYKYAYQGHDKASFRLSSTNEEINQLVGFHHLKLRGEYSTLIFIPCILLYYPCLYIHQACKQFNSLAQKHFKE